MLRAHTREARSTSTRSFTAGPPSSPQPMRLTRSRALVALLVLAACHDVTLPVREPALKPRGPSFTTGVVTKTCQVASPIPTGPSSWCDVAGFPYQIDATTNSGNPSTIWSKPNPNDPLGDDAPGTAVTLIFPQDVKELYYGAGPLYDP